MKEVFRLRPANKRTVEELQEPYLWFSRPSEYNDINDANVFAFIQDNENIKQSFIRLFGEYAKIFEQSELTGICSFTKTLPVINLWRKFPNGKNAIFIKYDKNFIEKHFQDTFGLGDCFKEIEYLDNPTLFKKYSNHDILWKKTENVELYKSVREIEKDTKLRDELFLKMFTRLNKKFSFQNELRIILGGSNIPDKAKIIKGYKVPIPKKAILSVYLQPQTPSETIKEIENLDIKIHKQLKNN